jgi:ATP-dependent Zn protease
MIFGFWLVPGVSHAAEQTASELWPLISNWLPMLVLIGVWIYFMKSMNKDGGATPYEEINRHLEKIETALERIARALEKK